jgi:hypothetical protein
MVDVAARQSDSRGDDAQAIAVLEALLYRAELGARTGVDAAPDLADAR